MARAAARERLAPTGAGSGAGAEGASTGAAGASTGAGVMGVGTGAVEEGAVGRRSFLRAGTSTKNDVEGFSAPARAARSEASAGEYEGIAEGDAPAPTPDPDAPSVW